MNIDNDQIVSMATTFANCDNTNIQDLSIILDNNQISDLSFLRFMFQKGENYQNLRRLTISINQNKLQNLNGIRQAFSNLDLQYLALEVQGNQINDISLLYGTYNGLANLNQIDLLLSKNQITDLDPAYKGLQWIIQSGNIQKFQKMNVWASQNQIKAIPASLQSLAKFPNYNSFGLHLDENQITDPSDLFTSISYDMPNLEEIGIDISGNNIPTFPDLKISGKILPKLQYLTLTMDNTKLISLDTLTEYFTHLSKLDYFWLKTSDNLISSIDNAQQNIIDFTKIIQFTFDWGLNNNKFDTEQEQKIDELESIICKGKIQCYINHF